MPVHAEFGQHDGRTRASSGMKDDQASLTGVTTALSSNKAVTCALRQVRNLRSCIKVALDFVSPESLPQLELLAGDRRALALQETGPPDQKCVAPWRA